MPKVIKIEPSKHINGRFLVFFGEEPVKVTEDEVLMFSLFPGKELSEQELLELRRAGQLSSAKAAAARMLSAKPMSRGELIQKLLTKGEDPAAAEAAADRLQELGVVNDAAYAALVVRHYCARGYGVKKLENELYRRKVPRPLWSEALKEAQDSEETIDRLIEQKLRRQTGPLDAKALSKLQNFLLRRGFGWSEVHDALARVNAECGMRNSEFLE